MERIKYQDKTERDNIIAIKEIEDLKLISEENIIEDNFLTFYNPQEMAIKESEEAKRLLNSMDYQAICLIENIITLLISKKLTSIADLSQENIETYQKIIELKNKLLKT